MTIVFLWDNFFDFGGGFSRLHVDTGLLISPYAYYVVACLDARLSGAVFKLIVAVFIGPAYGRTTRGGREFYKRIFKGLSSNVTVPETPDKLLPQPTAKLRSASVSVIEKTFFIGDLPFCERQATAAPE